MNCNYQQAFDFMNEIYEYDFCTDETNVVAQTRTELELLCMKAILKQIPMEHHHTIVREAHDAKIRISVCPDCLGCIMTTPEEFPRFCPWCGQAIDWSE